MSRPALPQGSNLVLTNTLTLGAGSALTVLRANQVTTPIPTSSALAIETTSLAITIQNHAGVDITLLQFSSATTASGLVFTITGCTCEQCRAVVTSAALELQCISGDSSDSDAGAVILAVLLPVLAVLAGVCGVAGYCFWRKRVRGAEALLWLDATPALGEWGPVPPQLETGVWGQIPPESDIPFAVWAPDGLGFLPDLLGEDGWLAAPPASRNEGTPFEHAESDYEDGAGAQSLRALPSLNTGPLALEEMVPPPPSPGFDASAVFSGGLSPYEA